MSSILSAADTAAVARVIELTRDYPPNSEHWDTAERHGSSLTNQLREWLREKV